jgi:hypothetical protein
MLLQLAERRLELQFLIASVRDAIANHKRRTWIRLLAADIATVGFYQCYDC